MAQKIRMLCFVLISSVLFNLFILFYFLMSLDFVFRTLAVILVSDFSACFYFLIIFNPMLPQWYAKDRRTLCQKKYRWQI